MDVATKVYLYDFQEIVVPPCKNTYPICNLTLWGSEKLAVSAYQLI
jgi:hypothetical protein